MLKEKPSDYEKEILGEHTIKFIQFLDALPLPALLINLQGKVIHVNNNAAELVKPLAGDIIGTVIPHCRPDESTLVWEIKTKHKPIKLEFRIFPLDFGNIKLLCLLKIESIHQKKSYRSSDSLFNLLFEHSNDGIAIFDRNMYLIEWNRAMERVTGFTAKEVIGKSLRDIAAVLFPSTITSVNSTDPLKNISPDRIPKTIEELIEQGTFEEVDKEIRDKSGSEHTIRYRIFPVFWDGDVFPGVLVHDVTELKITEEVLKASELRFRTLIEAMGEGTLAMDNHQNILFVNPVVESVLGMEHGELVGKKVSEFLDAENEALLTRQSRLVTRGITNRFEMEILDNHRNRHTLQVTLSPWKGADDRIRGSIAVFIDITERKVEEERLRFTSTHDEVTNIFNRNYFEEEKNRLRVSRRYPVSVIMIDMDEMKVVNDTYGHRAGDDLLRKFSSIGKQIFRADDVFARIGGDEFAVFLPGTSEKVAKTVVERLKRTFIEHNVEFPDSQILFSVGSATAQTPDELEDAIRRADNRMYREKRQKREANESQKRNR